MFKFFKRNKNSKKVESKQCKDSKYNGQVYRGVFDIDGTIVQGAYVRDGARTFVCEEGVAQIAKGVKIKQLASIPVPASVEFYLHCLEHDYCTPFTVIK